MSFPRECESAIHLINRIGEETLRAKKRKPKIAGVLGLGLDGHDGHTRITRGGNFFLYGGSELTHARMQETALKVNKQLEKRGKRLEDVSVDELRDICHEAAE